MSFTSLAEAWICPRPQRTGSVSRLCQVGKDILPCTRPPPRTCRGSVTTTGNATSSFATRQLLGVPDCALREPIGISRCCRMLTSSAVWDFTNILAPAREGVGHSSTTARPTFESVAVVGVGYVGLPLAVALNKRGFDVLGFDVNPDRVGQLRDANDITRSVGHADLVDTRLKFTLNPSDMLGRTCFIVAVPTPVTGRKAPDLQPLRLACATVGEIIGPGALVVIEATVYPGATR